MAQLEARRGATCSPARRPARREQRASGDLARSRAATSTPTSSGTTRTGSATTRAGPTRSPARASSRTRSTASTSPCRNRSGWSAVIVTWNGPPGFCAMGGAPALAAGCCLVVKSPELAPFSPVTFGRLCLEAGIPPGVVNVVTGGPDVGNALVSHPGVDKISFTGGTATGKKSAGGVRGDAQADGDGARRQVGQHHLRRRRRRRRDPAVVALHEQRGPGLLDADPSARGTPGLRACHRRSRRAAEPVVAGRPVRPRRHHGSGHQRRRRRTDPRRHRPRPRTPVPRGPVRRSPHRWRARRRASSSNRRSSPTSTTAPIAQNEIFGPVLCVMPFDDEDEAVALANDTDTGSRPTRTPTTCTGRAG